MIRDAYSGNIVDVIWSFLSLCFLIAFCVYKISPYLPRQYETFRLYVLFQDLIRYGKTKKNLKRNDWLSVFDVPKRWFWHFYAISVIWNGFLLIQFLVFSTQPHVYPHWLTAIFDILTSITHTDSRAPQLPALLVQLLLWIHSLRRLLECLYVSVFSDGSMHLVQYVFGLGYYIFLGLTVHCSDRLGCGFSSELNWIHIAGFILYILASILQHQSIVLLARLRTGNSGKVETLDHKEPKGDWFELVSCPHYFAELLIYISLGLVFGGLCITWWLVVFYVLFNQALAAQLCHDFYISKYESYPKNRKAFIPLVL